MEPGKGPVSLAEWLIISVDHPTASLLCKDPSIRGATAQCMRTVFALARNEQFERFRKQGAGNIVLLPAFALNRNPGYTRVTEMAS